MDKKFKLLDRRRQYILGEDDIISAMNKYPLSTNTAFSVVARIYELNTVSPKCPHVTREYRVET